MLCIHINEIFFARVSFEAEYRKIAKLCRKNRASLFKVNSFMNEIKIVTWWKNMLLKRQKKMHTQTHNKNIN